jgi:hypothetical protein
MPEAATAPTEFAWDDLARYKAEQRFLDGYPPDQRSFFSPRDDLHPMLASLLASAQHSVVLNMNGYDDPELDELIRGKLGVYTVTGSTNWSISGESEQDNQLTLSRNAVVASELRAVLDLNHDWMLKQMAEARAKASTPG